MKWKQAQMEEARFYDGKHARPHFVTLNFYANNLIGKVEQEGVVDWNYTDIKIIEKPHSGRKAILAHRDDSEATLYVTRDQYDQIIEHLPQSAHSIFDDIISARSIGFWLIVGVVTLFAVFWGIPKLAGPLAKHFPHAWEEKLGRHVVAQLTYQSSPCEKEGGLQALDRMIDTLTHHAKLSEPVKIQVVSNKTVNAFAAPAGHIVVFSGLIERAESAEEVAGVIAHEMGHVIHKHPTQALVKHFGILFITQLMMGDSANFITELGSSLFLLKHSRDAETEADIEAYKILDNANVTTLGMTTFFERMAKKEKMPGMDLKILSYFSSHPPLKERSKLASVRNSVDTKAILTDNQWQSLKTICAGGKT